jgi:signal transduction histidine kinase
VGEPAIARCELPAEYAQIDVLVWLLHSLSGESTGIAAVVRDVTAQWQREQELRKRLAALETGS